jgi:acylphosphatase
LKDAVTAYHVTGHVQGVGFRWWTQQHAKRLSLRGYVRNLADGSVEVQASGSADSLAQLHALLLRGPSGARVRAVNVSDVPDPHVPDGFQIL